MVLNSKCNTCKEPTNSLSDSTMGREAKDACMTVRIKSAECIRSGGFQNLRKSRTESRYRI